MKRALPLLCLLLLIGCDKQSNMKLPIQHLLDCPPFGKQPVIIDREEDRPKYHLPGVSPELAATAHDEVVFNWAFIWDSARPKLEGILKEYEYEQNLEELVADPKN